MAVETFIGKDVIKPEQMRPTLETKNIGSDRPRGTELPSWGESPEKDVSMRRDSDRPDRRELPSFSSMKDQDSRTDLESDKNMDSGRSQADNNESVQNNTEKQNTDSMEQNRPEKSTETANESNENSNLTEEQKMKIKEETNWSDEIIDSISSWEEYEIYKNAGLTEAEINGKKCLIRNDIDWNQKDIFGRTNKERAKQGLPPLSKTGNPIELHHIGQHSDSPLAELTPEEHRGKGNDGILHNKSNASEIDRIDFAAERSSHWKERVNGGNSK
ncbi:A nuclease of the HNH/ENDO VII superfamily with conserved LHH [Ruminococcaceae bacterium FB2012]|nr:A nuclease of the HNH/ENDO VII superfamily with conserved LHH [Ruminococcaceae bacterium FB2012]